MLQRRQMRQARRTPEAERLRLTGLSVVEWLERFETTLGSLESLGAAVLTHPGKILFAVFDAISGQLSAAPGAILLTAGSRRKPACYWVPGPPACVAIARWFRLAAGQRATCCCPGS